MKPPRCIVFTDLDDTLFLSPRKHPGRGAGHAVLARRTDGQAHAHATRASAWLLDLLGHDPDTLLVPVTGRTAEALARVDIPWRGPRIIDHGLRVLDASGADDAAWRDHTVALLDARRAALEAAADAARARLGSSGLQLRVITVHGRPAYVVLKHPARQPGALDAVRDAVVSVAQGHDMNAFWTDSTLTLFPNGAGKRHAVRYLRDQLDPLGEAATVGVGDAASDLPFMSECDLALTPTTSQLFHVLRAEAHRHGGLA